LAQANSSSTIEPPDVITFGPPLGEKLMSLDCVNRGTAPRDDSNSSFERWKATSMSAPAAKG
jgi:hypothetical protein